MGCRVVRPLDIPSSKSVDAYYHLISSFVHLLRKCLLNQGHADFLDEPTQRVLGVVGWTMDESDDSDERARMVLVWARKRKTGTFRPDHEEYVSLAGSLGSGEEARYRENERLARLLARYWHENPKRLARVLTELEIWINVSPSNSTGRGGPEVAVRQPEEAHHAAPRCLLRLHAKANGAALDGEGIQAWLEWEWEATRWRVPAEISEADLRELVAASGELLERGKHRLVHASDWQRWGSRGGRERVRRYGNSWMSLLALRRWGKVSQEDLEASRPLR